MEDPMILAKNNLTVKLDRNGPVEYALLNPVAGNFDILSEEEQGQLDALKRGEAADPAFTDALLARGYLYRTEEEQARAREAAYREFKEEAGKGQIQLMLIPTYACNLACTYCFQHGIDGRPELIAPETVDAFFDYVREEFRDASPKPFITLFGGEPLMNSPAQRRIIEQIVDRCASEGYELSAVTNGYDFAEYADLLSRARIKEIQFTLDGTPEVHDGRRCTAGGKGTFDRVLSGIRSAVAAGMPVNLRSVTDKDNIGSLPGLAEILDKEGWLDLPPTLFKTQIGRNYELFECYEKPEHLFSQEEMWREVVRLSEAHPVLRKFHRPDFYGIRHLVDTGDMYLASFDTCPAAKTEWVFDLHGEIYGCTASCGRTEFRLGTYWPEVAKNEKAVGTWKARDVLAIEKCRDCALDVVCGGGCGVLAANRNQGEILSPDCRPVQELYDIGLNFYRKDLEALAAAEPEDGQDAPGAPQGTPGESPGGCLLCGKPLEYLSEAVPTVCDICGSPVTTNIRCTEGHVVCDACHNGDTLSHMEKLLLESEEVHPVRLAEQVFALPTMKVHGPEHHSMVPAVLEAAWQNRQGLRNPEKIKEAIRRGRDIKGGSCGFHGNCGACVGAGIAESIHLGARPASREERGAAMTATANALLAVSVHGGPLCCKRDSITAIEDYMERSGRYEGLAPCRYLCSFSEYNKGCLLQDCPYYAGAAGEGRQASGSGKEDPRE
jgi:uncharacterized protein